MRSLAAVLCTVTLAATAGAQTLEKRSLSLEGARRAVAAVTGEARAKGVGAVVAVVDDGGNLMALERVDGTFAAGAIVSTGKARTAALFKKPTAFFEDVVNKGRVAMTALGETGFTPLQGGVPIVVDGQIVGAVGVSGASSAKQDEEFATLGAAAVTATSDAQVTFIDAAHVAAAFQKGVPLVETPSYKVHASHRDGAGQAEVHTTETDIIHVLDGTATLVTGGTVVDGKTIAENEIRGAGVQGGEARALHRGDVVIVPHGVPHWFKSASSPFNYYVVKVR